MSLFIHIIGVLATVLLIFYVAVLILARVLRLKQSNSNIAMPVLIPIPIPTKDQPNSIYKLVAFVTLLRRWKLAEHWEYTLENGVTIVIPRDFDFDGASIPKPFWALLSPTGLLFIPGLIHDYAYKYDQLWQRNTDGSVSEYQKGAGKEYWDELFKTVGNNVNQVWLVNQIAKLAVAFGGGSTWNNYRNENAIADKPVIPPGEEHDTR